MTTTAFSHTQTHVKRKNWSAGKTDAYNVSVNIHIAIYSPKAAGILSAAIDLQAEKIIVLHRAEDEISGIRAVIQARGMQCETIETGFDAEIFRQLMIDLIKKHTDHSLYFNASCGYRKLVLLAYEQCFFWDIPVFMVDKFTNTLHWLNQKSNRQDHDLRTELRISEYLKLFNTQIVNDKHNRPEPEHRRKVTQWIIQNLHSHLHEISSLNHIAMMADSQHRARLNRQQLKDHTLIELLEQLQAAGQLKLKKNTVEFSDDESRFFCNGGWLEDHVYATLYGLRSRRPGISDISKGLVITRSQGTVKNEIDVIAMANNRLHIIECKTSKMEKSAKAKNTAASTIYRLGTLKSVAGGLSGKAMLVSFQPLSRHTLSRAKDLGVYCCSHMQLTQLKDHLYRFFDQDIS